MEPAGRAIHRVAAIRSRAVLAGDTWCVAIRTLHGAAQGVGGHASISARPMWPGTPQQNGATFALTVRMDSNARPTAGTGCAVAATAVLDCDAAEREASNSRDHSHAAAHPALDGAGPLRVARRARPHAHHSSPYPRPVQLLLIDQQIGSTLPLAQ